MIEQYLYNHKNIILNKYIGLG